MIARAYHDRLMEGLAQHRLEAVLAAAHCLEHLLFLAGPTAAAQVFAQACQEAPLRPPEAEGPA